MNQLQNLKPLTIDQYEQARQRAIERVKARIGDRPTRQQFQRELGALWTALDVLALIVFVAALAVSSAHIINHMGLLASASYNGDATAGIVLSADAYTITHQIAMILLAEASMLLFMVMHGMNTEARASRSVWLRYVSLPLVLALIAATFVFVANWQSGIGLLEAVMPPVFTVGIGLHLERLIVAGLRRRDELTRRYLTALEVYEAANEDPTKHPDYMAMLRQEVWSKLTSLPSNKDWRDAPPSVKHAAVRRELQRDQWAHEDAPELVEEWQPPRPTSARRGDTGTIPHTWEDLESTPMIVPNGAHGITDNE